MGFPIYFFWRIAFNLVNEGGILKSGEREGILHRRKDEKSKLTLVKALSLSSKVLAWSLY